MKAKPKSRTRELRDQDCANKLLSAALEKAKGRIAELESHLTERQQRVAELTCRIAGRDRAIDEGRKREWEQELRNARLAERCELIDADTRDLKRELDGAQLNLTAQMAMNADAKKNIAEANELIEKLRGEKYEVLKLAQAYINDERPWYVKARGFFGNYIDNSRK